MRTARALLSATAAACFAAAAWLVPPSLDRGREFAAWFARPALLPFAWDARQAAQHAGDAAEAFARGQQILALLPTWTDGHIVFAFDYALGDERRLDDPAARGRAAYDRLQVALAWLETARGHAGPREVELLQLTSLLPQLAVHERPELAELLRPESGAPALADHFLAAAERLGGGPRVREHRTFLAAKLAAALLAAGDLARAQTVLADAIRRCDDVTDRAVASEWRQRLTEASRRLAGDTTVDTTAIAADPRLAPLLPFLR